MMGANEVVRGTRRTNKILWRKLGGLPILPFAAVAGTTLSVPAFPSSSLAFLVKRWALDER
jgi:hypothetical protein